MDNTWFEHFQLELQQETDTLFERVQDKKFYIQKLLGQKFEEEAEYHQFAEQYEISLQSIHRDIATLQREIQAEKRKQADEGELLTVIADVVEDVDNLDNVEQDETPIEETPDILDSVQSSGMDFTMFSHPPQRPDEPLHAQPESRPIAMNKTQVEQENIKKTITDMFLWIYFPRVHEGADHEFFTKRSVQINQLKENKLFDAIEVLIRMPFEESDVELWYNLLPRTDKAGKSLETTIERIYRFRLWDRMLDVGVKRAEARSTAEPDTLYQHFQTMREQKISIRAYLETLQDDLQHQADELKRQLHELKDATQ